MTRPQVSRLLKRAREEGIVEIRILDGSSETSGAADELRRRYGLREVHLAPSLAGPEDLTRRSVGRLAGQVLRSVIRGGAIVGIGDGASMSAVADGLTPPASPIACVIVPLNGGYWYAGPHAEPFRRIGEVFGATAMGLPAPGIVGDPATKRSLYEHGAVKTVLGLWGRLDVAMYGIGSRAWNDETFGPQMYERLNAAGADGELLVAPSARLDRGRRRRLEGPADPRGHPDGLREDPGDRHPDRRGGHRGGRSDALGPRAGGLTRAVAAHHLSRRERFARGIIWNPRRSARTPTCQESQ